jgi:hypothetical protein
MRTRIAPYQLGVEDAQRLIETYEEAGYSLDQIRSNPHIRESIEEKRRMTGKFRLPTQREYAQGFLSVLG